MGAAVGPDLQGRRRRRAPGRGSVAGQPVAIRPPPQHRGDVARPGVRRGPRGARVVFASSTWAIRGEDHEARRQRTRPFDRLRRAAPPADPVRGVQGLRRGGGPDVRRRGPTRHVPRRANRLLLSGRTVPHRGGGSSSLGRSPETWRSSSADVSRPTCGDSTWSTACPRSRTARSTSRTHAVSSTGRRPRSGSRRASPGGADRGPLRTIPPPAAFRRPRPGAGPERVALRRDGGPREGASPAGRPSPGLAEARPSCRRGCEFDRGYPLR